MQQAWGGAAESAVAAGLSGIANPAAGAALQLALNAGADLAGLLSDNGLTLDLDGLTPFARWMPGFKHGSTGSTMVRSNGCGAACREDRYSRCGSKR